MDLILEDFKTDLARVRKLLELIQMQEAFAANHQAPVGELSLFVTSAIQILTKAQESHADFRILVGTMILYLGGRFEDYIRSEFESLCETLANRCNSYDRLPKDMRVNLITMTANVMENPRKYGHGEKGVESFVKNLAANLSDKTKLEVVNVRCLSITHENMRPDVLADLFARIGIRDIWKTVGEQATVKAYFETDDNARCADLTKALLTGFMDSRNGIAHPSGNVNWPNEQDVSRYIDYFVIIASAISELVRLSGITIPAKALLAAPPRAPAAVPEAAAVPEPIN